MVNGGAPRPRVRAARHQLLATFRPSSECQDSFELSAAAFLFLSYLSSSHLQASTDFGTKILAEETRTSVFWGLSANTYVQILAPPVALSSFFPEERGIIAEAAGALCQLQGEGQGTLSLWHDRPAAPASQW